MRPRLVATLGSLVILGCGAAPQLAPSTTADDGSSSRAGPAGPAVDAATPSDDGATSGGAGATPSDAGGEASLGVSVSGCSDLFTQDVVQTYELEISPSEWAQLEDEFKNRLSVPVGVDYNPYHPITFHFGGETVTDAYVRLKGQSSWRQTIAFDGDDAKAQFVVAFDKLDQHARFHGVSQLVFDMPRNDLTFLHERLSNTWLRQIGIFAPCSNSARLVINGSYYGLYVSEESKGSEQLIKEFFPDAPSGDLFEGGYTPQTNKTTPNWPRLQRFWDAKDIAAVAAVVDLPSSLLDWAAECLLNDGDGYWGGAHNFYLYDQGAKGYVWLPSDTDATFDWLTSDTTHPLFWWSGRSTVHTGGQHYLIVINDPTWKAKYVDALAAQLDRFEVKQLQGWVDTWSAQIADAVASDPHKAATVEQFKTAVLKAHNEVAARADFVRRWISCERDPLGEDGTDGDHDGARWCDDCRDDDANVKPGVPDICGNGLDDNCNGVIDEGCPGEDGGTVPDGALAPPADGGDSYGQPNQGV